MAKPTRDPAAQQRHKSFYRKLDEILRGIDREQGLESMLTRILAEVTDEVFTDELGISSGRLYRLEGDAYVVVRSFGARGEEVLGLKVSRHYPIIQSMQPDEVVYFTSDDTRVDPEFEKSLGVVDFAAFHFGRSRQWIAAFGLDRDADLEEVMLVLNTLRHAIAHRLHQISLEGQLAEAREIQASLLPARAPELAGYEFAGLSFAADEVGGDVFDFMPLDEHLVGVAIADASGHGLPAALQARDVITGLRMGVERDFKITAVIRRLNNVIHRSGLTSRFVSVFYGELEENGTFVYCNAGHEPGLLLRANGEVEQLGSTGIVLGPVEHAQYRRHLVRLDPGDALALYSDGMVERAHGDDEFGLDRLTRQLRQELLTGKELGPLCRSVLATVKGHGGGGPWTDDATLVVVRRVA